MDFVKFNTLKNLMCEEGFCFSYSGYVSHDILAGMGLTLRHRLADMGVAPQQIKQVFSIFVEVMENIIRYGDTGPQSISGNGGGTGGGTGTKPSYGALSVSKTGSAITIISGNFVPKNQAERVRHRLDVLRESNAEELRAIYRATLKHPLIETAKGAQLGLIEIARRAKTPPEYELSEGTDDTAFFVLKVSA